MFIIHMVIGNCINPHRPIWSVLLLGGVIEVVDI